MRNTITELVKTNQDMFLEILKKFQDKNIVLISVDKEDINFVPVLKGIPVLKYGWGVYNHYYCVSKDAAAEYYDTAWANDELKIEVDCRNYSFVKNILVNYVDEYTLRYALSDVEFIILANKATRLQEKHFKTENAKLEISGFYTY